MQTSGQWTILMADDDVDDRLLVKEAAEGLDLKVDLRFVEDGEALIDYLHRRGEYAVARQSPRPDLILLDLRMPKKTGGEALRELKAHSQFKYIPVVVLTNSEAREDIQDSYEVGASSYIVKPERFDRWVETLQALQAYWFGMVSLVDGGAKKHP